MSNPSNQGETSNSDDELTEMVRILADNQPAANKEKLKELIQSSSSKRKIQEKIVSEYKDLLKQQEEHARKDRERFEKLQHEQEKKFDSMLESLSLHGQATNDYSQSNRYLLKTRYRMVLPENFGVHPTIHDNQRREYCNKLFPYRNSLRKYSVEKGEYPIKSFLHDINEAQKTLLLSEKELLNEIFSSTTGKLRALLENYIDANMPLDVVYLNVLSLYGQEKSSDAARKELKNYRIDTASEIKVILCDIGDLSLKANSNWPTGEVQRSRAAEEATSTLLQILPKSSAILIEEICLKYSTTHMKPPSFEELAELLRPHEARINFDIQKHSAVAYKKPQPNHQGRKQPHAISVVDHNKPTRSHKASSEASTFDPDNRGKKGKKVHAGIEANRPYNRALMAQQNESLPPSQRYCIHCSTIGHIPTECPYTVDDYGRRISCEPEKEYCPNCPVWVKRAKHPKGLCLYRDKGPRALSTAQKRRM